MKQPQLWCDSHITVFDLKQKTKVQDCELNGLMRHKAWGIIELKTTDKNKTIDLKMVFMYIERAYSQAYCKIYIYTNIKLFAMIYCFYSLIGGDFLQNHG